MMRTGTVRRGLAAVVLVLAVAGAAGCGEDNGGVMETPTTTGGSSGPATTRNLDYGG